MKDYEHMQDVLYRTLLNCKTVEDCRQLQEDL